MTYYYTYKVTLKKGSLSGKVYFGQHTTTNLNDGYRGSGTIVKQYYKKYPEHDSSDVQILYFYSSKEDLNRAEKELVAKHLGKDYCLNIAEGGYGGNLGEAVNKKRSDSRKKRITIINVNNNDTLTFKGVKECLKFLHIRNRSYYEKLVKGKTIEKIKDWKIA